MRGHGLTGPQRADLAGGVVTHREHEVHHRRIGGSELGHGRLAEGLARSDYHLKSGVKQVRGVIDLMHEIREGVRDARDQTKP